LDLQRREQPPALAGGRPSPRAGIGYHRRSLVLGAIRLTLALSVAAGLAACDRGPVPPAPGTRTGAVASPGPGRLPHVGYLYFGAAPPAYSALTEAFLQGLADLGYVDGQNVAVDSRYANGQRERLPALIAELVQVPVDVLVLADSISIPIAQATTSTIPIVMAISGDPVAEGIVPSLARPGGNVTGLSNMSSTLSGKRVEYLKEAAPGTSRLAVLVNPDSPTSGLQVEETAAAAHAFGVQIQALSVRRAEDLAPAFDAAVSERADGLLVLPDPVTSRERDRIVAFAAEASLPGMYGPSEFVQAGGLIAYGPDRAAMFRRAAAYVDRILKGARAGELPIEQPTRFELALNLKTAEALGLTVPRNILLDATEVVH
jgi:putative ABC transport system substrate-binding protein